MTTDVLTVARQNLSGGLSSIFRSGTAAVNILDQSLRLVEAVRAQNGLGQADSGKLLETAFDALHRHFALRDHFLIDTRVHPNLTEIGRRLGAASDAIQTSGFNPGSVFHGPAHPEHLAHLSPEELPKIRIGAHVALIKYVEVDIGRDITIEDFVWMATKAKVLNHRHDPAGGGVFCRAKEFTTYHPLTISSFASLGMAALVLPQVPFIGKGAFAAANATINSWVGDYSIVGGVPARTIRYNDKLASKLEDALDPVDLEDIEKLIELIGRQRTRTTLLILNSSSANIYLEGACRFKNIFGFLPHTSYHPALLQEFNKAQIRNIKLRGGINFTNLPLESASLDCVVVTLPEEDSFEGAAIEEIARVLMPGGEVLFYLKADREFTLPPSSGLTIREIHETAGRHKVIRASK